MLAVQDHHLAAAWYTEAEQRPRLRVAQSDDEGATWQVQTLQTTNPAGRPDLAYLEDDTLLILWLAKDEQGHQLQLQRIRGDAAVGSVLGIARTKGTRASGFPRIVARRQQAIIAWTQNSAGHPTVTVVAVDFAKQN